MIEPPRQNDAPRAAKVLAGLHLAVTTTLVVALSWFELSSVDLGYHIEYGRQFLRTGRIVEVDPFLYSEPGRRFVNANWLSQAVMAFVFDATGWQGLFALRFVLTLAVFACVAGALRSLGLGAGAIAWAWLCAALGAYERLTERPELFSYACLAAQAWLLLRGPEKRSTRLGVPLIQVLWVNLHSYFLVGLMVAGALALGDLCRGRGRLRVWAASWLPLLLMQAAACLANPWLVEGATFPLRTVGYLHRENVMAQDPMDPVRSPWGVISEFQSPFGFIGQIGANRTTQAYLALLGLTAAALLAAAWRRRWGWLLALLVLVALSTQMRRNIALFAVGGAPLIVAALSPRRSSAGAPIVAGTVKRPPETGPESQRVAGSGRLAVNERSPGMGESLSRRLGPVLRMAAIVLALWWLHGIWSGRFYFDERRPARRLATGWCDHIFPFDAIAWMNRQPELRPRLFSDLTLCSNVLPWIRDELRPQFITTNTFAYSPDRLMEAWDVGLGKVDYRRLFDEHGINVAMLRAHDPMRELIGALARDAGWALVYFDTRFVLFARRTPEHARLIAACEQTPSRLDPQGWIAESPRRHETTAYRLAAMGGVPLCLGWHAQARPLFAEAVARQPVYFEAWNNLGVCYVGLGRAAAAAGRMDDAERELTEARRCLERAARLYPTFVSAWYNLGLCRGALGGAAGMRGDMTQARLNYAAARDCFAKVLRISPDNAAARSNLELSERALGTLGGTGGP
ncbi:MAG: hypothetical protein HUU22_14250 [Phycisphaerae bacterium]|nr:hypothetical protein [Phycisphaerae bacterium]NUQ47182.1 hypothetical protein [Phycisphaerae bacterium]